MDIENSPPIEAVGEREIDYTIAQLLATSTQFRRWLVSQVAPESGFEEYIGVITHASYAGEGESDIELGFLTQKGDRHVLLIENKINAAKQPDQTERYYNRGEVRVEQGCWDSFTVCLLAPKSYISPDDEAGFESIISYEKVQEQLDELVHDGTPFFQDVFEAAMTKSKTVDASGTIATIEKRFQAQTELAFTKAFDGKKRLSFQSTHPQHPDAVWYDMYIAKVGKNGRTNVRLHIESIDGLSEERRDSLKSILSQHMESLPEYEWHFHRKANIATNIIWHEEAIQNSSYENHIDAVVEELLQLTATFHPILVESHLG